MSDYYVQFHRWEALAEFHFNINEDLELNDDNLIYCLCSRVFIKDFVKTYYDEEAASESDQEPIKKSQYQELEDQSHVHFSNDTCYKVKCDKDEGASCYGSASHTENYCSTDEHDPAQLHYAIPNALQPSDSGADLTYQDSHFDYAIHDKFDKMDQDLPSQIPESMNENYLSEKSWEKFWTINGERLIWDSWITKYSDYINPSYLDDNNDLMMDDNNIPKPKSSDNIKVEEFNKIETSEDQIRERKYSYDSKVNPCKKLNSGPPASDPIAKNSEATVNKDECWLPVARRRSYSEHGRMLSPRTITGTDSMTNVTKMTISSYDVTSSHVTSVSTPTDTYSVSSTSSDDQSNDKTRIANVVLEEAVQEIPLEEMDTEQYWQLLWKKHFGEQYALHFANYTVIHESKEKETPSVIEAEINKEIYLGGQESMSSIDVMEELSSIDKDTEKNLIDKSIAQVEDVNIQVEDVNIQVEDVNIQVDNLQLQDTIKEEKPNKQKRRNKKNNIRYIGSVGLLLQNLIKDKQDGSMNSMFDEELSSNNGYECRKPLEADESSNNKDDQKESAPIDDVDGVLVPTQTQEVINNKGTSHDSHDDDDPPDENQVTLKRSHELDEEEYDEQEKINSTFQIMGFSINSNKMPKGEIVYRKHIRRLRAPRNKRFGGTKKTYFDDDGNPCRQVDQEFGLQGEKEVQTDDDSKVQTKLDVSVIDDSEQKDPNPVTEKESPQKIENQEESHKTTALEASNVALPVDSDGSLGEADCEDLVKSVSDEGPSNQTEVKRKRRQKQKRKAEGSIELSDMPEELKDDPKMKKYWKKRHSLFHRFDEGIKLDRESWFSVTPENVAWHIANKYVYDVVLDAFCGAGGNTIQFARVSKKVIAIDIDPAKIEMAKHNALIYGVADRIEFIVGDFFELAPTLTADMVFLSPPWGGPKYSENYEYDLETMLIPKPASELMSVARTISSSISLYLPRNTNSNQILSLAKDACCSVEIEQSYLDRRFVAITAYFYE